MRCFFLAALACFGLCTTNSTTPFNTLVAIAPSIILPGYLDGAAGVYSLTTNSLLMLCGQSAAAVPDFTSAWSFSIPTSAWTKLAPCPVPIVGPGRYIADPYEADASVMLYGGLMGSSQAAVVDIGGDVWQYHIAANRWSKVKPMDPPLPPRALHATVPLSKGACVLVFGGYANYTPSVTASDNLMIDVANNLWFTLDAPQPPPRIGFFHFEIENVVYIGGGCAQDSCITSGSPRLSDFWSFSLQTPGNCSSGAWQQISNSTNQALLYARAGVYMTGNPQSSYHAVLLGGATQLGLSGALQVYAPGSPAFQPLTLFSLSTLPPLSLAAMSFSHSTAESIFSSPAGPVAYFFGGATGAATFSNLWAFSPPPVSAFFEIDPTVNVLLPPRMMYAGVQAGSTIWIFNGLNTESRVFADVWMYNILTAQWAQPSWMNQGGVSGVAFNTAVVSPLDDTVLVTFGGFSGLAPNNQTGVFLTPTGQIFYSNSLTPNPPQIPVPPRAFHNAAAFALNATHWAMYVMHGINATSLYGSALLFLSEIFYGSTFSTDMWRLVFPSTSEMVGNGLVLSATWERLPCPTEACPGPRIAASDFALPNVQRNDSAAGLGQWVIFGGNNNSANFNQDTWVLDIASGTWTEAVPTGARPPGRAGGAATVLRDSSVMVLGPGMGLKPGTSTVVVQHAVFLGRLVWVGAGKGTAAVWAVAWEAIEPVITANSPLAPFNARAFAGPGIPSDSFMLVAGATSPDGTFSTYSATNQLLLVRIGCPAGSYSPNISSSSCQPCPLGTYSTDSGAVNCIACPGGSFTSAIGSSSLAACHVCRPGSCDRGSCTVLPVLFTVTCHCPVGWFGSRCAESAILIDVVIALAVIGLTAAIALVLRRFNLRAKNAIEYSTLQEELLSKRDDEISELKSVWAINFADITLIRRVDVASQGAFGEVWAASWQDRTVVVKRLKSMVITIDAGVIDEFTREMEIMRALSHRNIVFFFGGGVDQNNVPFLVTELMPRGALKNILHNSTVELSWPRRMGFLNDTAAGLAFLHTRSPPRIHRDIKSANLLVTDSWVVKIADFGTARLVDRGEDWAKQHADQRGADMSAQLTTGIGTLLWCSPEILARQSYGLAADIYSFAIVMFEVKNRVLPFAELKRSWDIASAVESGARPPVDGGTPAPPGYTQLMQECWAATPDQRPAAAAVIARLAAISSSVQ